MGRAVNVGGVHEGITWHHGDHIGFVGHPVHMLRVHLFTEVFGIRHHAHTWGCHAIQVGIETQLSASRSIQVRQSTAQAVAHAMHSCWPETQVLLPDEFFHLLHITFEGVAKTHVDQMPGWASAWNRVEVGAQVRYLCSASRGDYYFLGSPAFQLCQEAKAA